MRKLILTVLGLCAITALAAFPLRTYTVVIDMDKVTGNWDSFNWKWIGFDSVSNTFTFTQGTTPTTLTNLYITVKMSRLSETGAPVAAIQTTNVTVSTSNVIWVVANTNVPTAGSYFVDILCSDTAATNLTRSIGQGKITVFRSDF